MVVQKPLKEKYLINTYKICKHFPNHVIKHKGHFICIFMIRISFTHKEQCVRVRLTLNCGSKMFLSNFSDLMQ